MDLKLLKKLEVDSRVGISDIAEELGEKAPTLYLRLSKLRENPEILFTAGMSKKLAQNFGFKYLLIYAEGGDLTDEVMEVLEGNAGVLFVIRDIEKTTILFHYHTIDEIAKIKKALEPVFPKVTIQNCELHKGFEVLKYRHIQPHQLH